jgi:hypothetical protein
MPEDKARGKKAERGVWQAPLHLIKLSVGTESVEGLRRWQTRRLKLSGRVFHQTRMMPRRAEELLEGGSIYWVIKGLIQARQRLQAIEPKIDAEGRRSTLLVLEPELRRTVPAPHRAFQGWRYLAPEDAPADLGEAPSDAPDMPAEMVAELRALGLL